MPQFPLISTLVTQVAEPSTLHADVASAFKDVQWWLSTFLAALPTPPSRASHLKDSLKANYRVCWQIFEVVKAADAFTGARHVPSSGSMQKILLAAAAQNVPPDTIEGLRSALSRFDKLAKSHAGDRDRFATMVSSMATGGAGGAGDTNETSLIACRRAAFRQDAQLWGSQVATFFGRMILRRTDEGVATALTTVKAGFQCLRAGVKPIVRGNRIHDRDGLPIPLSILPLDPQAFETHGAPLHPPRSTNPLPKLVQIKSEDGWTYHALGHDQLGLSGAVTITSAIQRPTATLSKLADGRLAFWAATDIVNPTELAVIEVAIHRASFPNAVPAFRLAPDRGHSFVAELTALVPQMPTFEKVISLGPVDRAPPVPEIKDYARLSDYTFTQLALNPADFDLYRVTIPYPPLHCFAILWFPVT